MKWGEPVLHTPSRRVEEIDGAVASLFEDMVETMYAAPGIGLAAPQIGVGLRVIVIDLSVGEEPGGLIKLVNPEIVWASDELFSYEEGCLSVPEYFDAVERPARVRVKYMTYAGETVEEECEGLYAVCIQHEMDHLQGVLFIDHLSRLKRDRAVAKVKKAARLAA